MSTTTTTRPHQDRRPRRSVPHFGGPARAAPPRRRSDPSAAGAASSIAPRGVAVGVPPGPARRRRRPHVHPAGQRCPSRRPVHAVWTAESVRRLLWVDIVTLCDALERRPPEQVAPTMWTLLDFLHGTQRLSRRQRPARAPPRAVDRLRRRRSAPPCRAVPSTPSGGALTCYDPLDGRSQRADRGARAPRHSGPG